MTRASVVNEGVDQVQELDLDLAQERAFGASAVPLMSLIGETGRAIMEPELTGLSKKWGYPDRLLCWLEPAFLKDVEKFYDESGPDMRMIFAEHQRIHLGSGRSSASRRPPCGPEGQRDHALGWLR